LLREDQAQAAVLPFDPQRSQAAVGAVPRLSSFLQPSPVETSVGASSPSPREELPSRQALLACPPGERRQKLLAGLQLQMAQTLELPAADLDPEEPLSYFGMDSLMAVEMRNRLQGRLDVALPLADLLRGVSLRKLTDSVLAQLVLRDHLPGAAEESTPDREVVTL
jgi:acyl carrier protein